VSAKGLPMRCPYCQQDSDKVIDSRASDEGRAIRRRRHCLACGKRFTTYEHVEETIKINVIKRDGARVPFDRTKIIAGLEKACFKRPVTAEQILKMVEEVEEDLMRRGLRDVPSLDIGQLVSDKLKFVDQVAYVRFASVYKQFRDMNDLIEEVKAMAVTMPSNRPGQGRLF
jgi:transcriptional repressor NrdR